MVGGGLFPSPPVTKKSPTPTEKSPTVISKRCWTLEYSGELEFSSPFMEQWTLDARGVLYHDFVIDFGFILPFYGLTEFEVCKYFFFTE